MKKIQGKRPFGVLSEGAAGGHGGGADGDAIGDA